MPLNRVFFALMVAPALAAAQPPAPPAFEVVSIKPHPLPGVGRKPWVPGFQCDPVFRCGVTGNRFREFTVTLADLIVDAWKVKKFQIVGLPGWGDARQDSFDIEARIGDGAGASTDDARLMLQSLLADRFVLRLHHETRLMPVYALVLSKSGLKVVPDQKVCSGPPGGRNGRSSARSSDILLPWAFYAQELAMFTDRPVIDETGLDGAGYCTSDGLSPLLAVMLDQSTGASIYTAIEEKWGLKLEPRKARVDVLVIDSVGMPSPN